MLLSCCLNSLATQYRSFLRHLSDCSTLTGVGISSQKSPTHPGGTRLGSPCLRASYGHTEKKAAALAAQRRAAAAAREGVQFLPESHTSHQVSSNCTPPPVIALTLQQSPFGGMMKHVNIPSKQDRHCSMKTNNPTLLTDRGRTRQEPNRRHCQRHLKDPPPAGFGRSRRATTSPTSPPATEACSRHCTNTHSAKAAAPCIALHHLKSDHEAP